MTEDILTNRIVEMNFRPVAEIGDWLGRIGMEVTSVGDGSVRLHNPYLNFTTAISDSLDPVTRAVTLAFLLVGAAWPRLCPDLLPRVNRVWRRHRTADGRA